VRLIAVIGATLLALNPTGLSAQTTPAAMPTAQLQASGQSGLTLAGAWDAALHGRGVPASARAGIAAAGGGLRLAGQIPNPGFLLSYTGAAPSGHAILDQPMNWVLTRGADQGAARAVVDRARADSTAQLAQMAAEVRRAFYHALSRETRQRLLLDQQSVADSVVGIARRRFQAGDASRFEMEQAELEALLHSQLVAAERDEVAVARSALGSAIGWAGGPLPALAGSLDDGLAATIGADSSRAIPMILAAQADSTFGAFALESAGRARIPFPSLEMGAEWNDPADPGHTYGVIGVILPVPIWNQGGAQVAQAQARADAAAAQVTEARLAARQLVEEAGIRLQGTATRARFARDSLVPAAAGLRSRALAAYQSGETGIVPVLAAIQREREVQLAAIDALMAFQDALASLHALTGVTP
jgi:cobalt-zinc-cadmium efflux system outer membrane protein